MWIPGGGLNLVCSALSPDSRFVACSDPLQVKLYQLRQRGSNPNHITVDKIKISHLVQPASALAFAAVRIHTNTHSSLSAALYR